MRDLAIHNTETGEIESIQRLRADEEIKIVRKITEKQKYMINKNKDLSDFIKCNEGSYFHSIYRYNYPYLDKLHLLDSGNKNNIHIVRFVLLSTYLSSDGYVRYKSRKIKKSKLVSIMDLSNSEESNKTYNKLIECNYIYEDEEGYIMINDRIMNNGKMTDWNSIKKSSNDTTYTRIFSQNIQYMYYNTDRRKRKQLGNLFKVLPFINFKYNVFCANPTETNENDIVLLNWTDLARICGYNDNKQIARFKKDMLNIEIYEGVSTVGMFIGAKGRSSIYINPKIFYGGSDIEDVKKLYTIFSMTDNQK